MKNRYLIIFDGPDISRLEIEEVLPAGQLRDAINGNTEDRKAIVEQMLDTRERDQLFRDAIGSRDWEVIWKYAVRFSILHRDV